MKVRPAGAGRIVFSSFVYDGVRVLMEKRFEDELLSQSLFIKRRLHFIAVFRIRFSCSFFQPFLDLLDTEQNCSAFSRRKPGREARLVQMSLQRFPGAAEGE